MTVRLIASYCLVAAAAALAPMAVQRRVDRRSFALFLLLPMLFLSPGFFADRTPIPLDHVRTQYAPWNAVPRAYFEPYNPALNDIATQFAPWAKAMRMAWKAGAVPFWDPWNGCGTPLAANGQSAAFSPFTFLMFALPLARAFVLLGSVRLLLALIGTWLWLSELGVERAAARFAAVAFAFSFALTPWLYHPAGSVICLWPWILFAVERLADPARAIRAFLLLLALLTVLPLCGHLETTALVGLFAALWFGSRLLARDLPNGRRVTRRAALATVLALGLSAFSWVPQVEAIAASNRLVLARSPDHLNYVPWVPYKPGWLGGFVTTLFPTSFGDSIASPMIPGAAGSIIEMGFGYIGVVGWGVALLILQPGRRRGPKEWTLLGLVLFGLAAAMGLPPLRTIVELLPGVRFVPPLRFLVIVAAAGTGLAALELDRVCRSSPRQREAERSLPGSYLVIVILAFVTFASLRSRYEAVGALPAQRSALLGTVIILVVAAAVAILAQGKIISQANLAAVLTVLVLVELMHQGRRLYRFYPSSDLYPDTALVGFLHSRPLPYRIVGEDRALFPNTNVFARVESIGTHDPAERRDYVAFLDATAGYPPFDYFKSVRDLNAPVLDFLNVRYLVSAAGRQPPSDKWNLVYAGNDGSVFQNRDALPRFFAPTRVRVVSPRPRQDSRVNAMDAFGQPLREFLKQGSFRDDALVLEAPGFPVGHGSHSNGRVEITGVEEAGNRVRLRVSVAESQQPAIIVSSVVSDGGWSAWTADGRRLPVSLANGPFLALAVPAGRHAIALRYLPSGFRVAAGLSLVSLLATGGCVWWQRRTLGSEGASEG